MAPADGQGKNSSRSLLANRYGWMVLKPDEKSATSGLVVIEFLQVFVQSMENKQFGIINVSFSLVRKLQWVKTFFSCI